MYFAKHKLIIGVVILIAFISIGIFGLFEFNHMTSAPMINCPYTQNNSSVCENSLNHINDWRQFLNVIFPSLLALSLLVFAIILYFFDWHKFLNQKQHFHRLKYYLDNNKLLASPNRIIRWLSLLINSPSFNAR